jgi:hypothetical protein
MATEMQQAQRAEFAATTDEQYEAFLDEQNCPSRYVDPEEYATCFGHWRRTALEAREYVAAAERQYAAAGATLPSEWYELIEAVMWGMWNDDPVEGSDHLDSASSRLSSVAEFGDDIIIE